MEKEGNEKEEIGRGSIKGDLPQPSNGDRRPCIHFYLGTSAGSGGIGE